MNRVYEREYNFGWLFMLAAFFILFLGMDIVWWQALGVVFLASFDLKFTTTTTTTRR